MVFGTLEVQVEREWTVRVSALTYASLPSSFAPMRLVLQSEEES